MNKKFQVGLFVGEKTIGYPAALSQGVRNALEEQGAQVITFEDLVPYHARDNAGDYFRIIFKIAASLNLDAYIVPAGGVGHFLFGSSVTVEELLLFLDKRKTLVIEHEIPGYLCIKKNNKPGMRECIRHLIEDRGYTKIGFISGHASSSSAIERETIWKEEMLAHGRKPLDRLFTRGDYSGLCEREVEQLLDLNPDIEAIACACDEIAMAVYRVMYKRGLRPGTDIAVTGFDDNPKAVHMDPPLSSVRLKAYDIGYLAGFEAIRLCKGLPQEHTEIQSQFIVRRSSGEGLVTREKLFYEILSSENVRAENIVRELLEETMSSGGKERTEQIRGYFMDMISRAIRVYYYHKQHPQDKEELISYHDIDHIFQKQYSNYLSLEGFQSCTNDFFRVLSTLAPQSMQSWVVGQVADLNLRIARIYRNWWDDDVKLMRAQEWYTLRVADQALQNSTNADKAIEQMLKGLQELGICQAYILLFDESVTFIHTKGIAMPEKLYVRGKIKDGRLEIVAEKERFVNLSEIFHKLAERDADQGRYTVGPIVASGEMSGILLIGSHNLDSYALLAIYLMIGISVRHLQMIKDEAELIETLSANNISLREESRQDDMTGLLNRRGFYYQLNRKLKSKSHYGENGAILLLDLDGLKMINDTYGHEQGDVTIKETGRILKECMGETSLLARIGGDEFLAFLTFSSERELEELKAQIQRKYKERNQIGDLPYRLSISVGAAYHVIDAEIAGKVQEWIKEADARLYEQKRRKKHSRSYQETGADKGSGV